MGQSEVLFGTDMGTWETCCKLIGNSMGTHREQNNWKKIPTPFSHPQKKKKTGPLECMLADLIGGQECIWDKKEMLLGMC
jgi:hypothetical protein